MGAIELFRQKVLPDGRIQNIYKLNMDPLNCCRIIFCIPNYQFSSISLCNSAASEQSDTVVYIDAYDQLLQYKDSVSLCSFTGTYRGYSADMIVSFRLNKLYAVSASSELLLLLKLESDKFSAAAVPPAAYPAAVTTV